MREKANELIEEAMISVKSLYDPEMLSLIEHRIGFQLKKQAINMAKFAVSKLLEDSNKLSVVLNFNEVSQRAMIYNIDLKIELDKISDEHEQSVKR